MKKYFLSLFSILIIFNAMGQDDQETFKFKLTGTDKTRWIFEKMQKTMGEKSQTSAECIFLRIIFSVKESAYFADKCGSVTPVTGKWNITKRGDEDYTLSLDKLYEITFPPNRVIQNKERKILRLRIPGKDMLSPSLDYFYYAE